MISLKILQSRFWLFRVRSIIKFKSWRAQISSATFQNAFKVHILSTKKIAYLDAAILCANSIWQHTGNAQILLYVDKITEVQFQKKKHKLTQPTRISIVEVNDKLTWQELKMDIILNRLEGLDLFCDADIHWNKPLPICTAPTFFVAEPGQLYTGIYIDMFKFLNMVPLSKDMYNTSIVSLPRCDRVAFRSDVLNFYEKISVYLRSEFLEAGRRDKIQRLIEQISISLAAQNTFRHINYLKQSDSPMDGGIAESYYLGTTRGWN
jgi:hypothetical protein